MQLPPRAGQRGPVDDDVTIMDHPGQQSGGSPQRPGLHSTDPDPEDRTIAVPLPPQYQGQGSPQGEEGKTAVYPMHGGGQPPQQSGHPHGPPPTGFQPPPPHEPEGAQGPLGKLKNISLLGKSARSEQPGGPGHTGPPPQGASGGKNKLMTPLIITAVVLSLALVGGLLLGNVFNSGGGGKKKEQPKPSALPKDFVQVADSSTKIKAAVPNTWTVSPQGQKTWSTSVAGLTDATARPVLRATPNLAQFPGTGSAPGLFVGLTTDMAPGKLPPPSLISHAGCTAGAKENYVSPDKALSGTVQRFTGCKTGTASVTEVGLRDQSGKFGAWVRIKETDNRNLTKILLDNLKLTAPA